MEKEYLKGIIYGRSGIGKSTWAVGGEEYGHTVVADTEKSTKFCRKKYPSIAVVNLETFDELNVFYNKIFEHLKSWKMYQKTPTPALKKTLLDLEVYFSGKNKDEITMIPKVDIVVVDSAMKAQEQSMQKVRPQDSFLEPTKRQLQDWNTSHDMMKLMFDYFLRLPCHVLFTALETYNYDSEGNIIKTYPLFSGKELPERLCSKVDEVIHLNTKKVGTDLVRVCRFEETSSIVCKDRTGLFKPTESVTFKEFLTRICGENKKEFIDLKV